MDERENGAVLCNAAPDCEMQTLLDREFPHGALCAVVHLNEGRIYATKTCVTGRLICDQFEKDDDGIWCHIIIDPRESIVEETDTIRLWIGPPRRLNDSRHLWEADVRPSSGAVVVLRLNAEPPEQWRATAAMRRAVTARYADRMATPERTA